VCRCRRVERSGTRGGNGRIACGAWYPKALWGRTCLYSRRHRSINTFASSTVSKISRFKHSSQNFPLNDSSYPFSLHTSWRYPRRTCAVLNSSLAHTRSQQAPCLHLPRELLWRSTRVMAGKTVSSAAKSQDAGPCDRKCSFKRCPPDQITTIKTERHDFRLHHSRRRWSWVTLRTVAASDGSPPVVANSSPLTHPRNCTPHRHGLLLAGR
jgi:hypothetical protein